MGIIYKSIRSYKVVGAGPGKVYPRITFPRELAEKIIGKAYAVELDDAGTIMLRPIKSIRAKVGVK
jgi:hypothetical protein